MPQKKKVVVPAKGAKAAPKSVAAKPSPKTSGTSAKPMKGKTSSVSAKTAKGKVKAPAVAAKNSVKTTAAKAPVTNAAPVAKAAPAAVAPKPAAKPVTATKPAVAAQAAAVARTQAPARTMTAAMSKPAQPKISAPAPAPATPVGAQAAKKPVSTRHGFKTNEYIVYPAHGVGQIVGIEEQEIAGMSLELFVITFEKDKMTLRVPTGKLESVGMRKLAEDEIVKKAMETLKGRARVKRTMWSRRAQEYEAKINSGDLVAIAEVVRDLYRSETQPEQSYSERQLYEAALDRMAREIAAVDRLDERGAVQKITDVLSKSARGRRAAADEAEADGDDDAVDADAQAA